MSRLTVDQLMQQIASTVNQDSTAPSDGGSEWLLWLSFMNRAQQEWSEAGEWEDLRTAYYPSITSGSSNASFALPADFKRLAAYVRVYDSTPNGFTEVPVILPEQIGLYYLPVDKFCYVYGDISNGYSLQINPATLSSGASILVPYFRVAQSLASPNDVPYLPDSQFLVDRTIAYVFEARSDPRFQEQEVKAREKLLNMLEYNNLNKYNSYGGAIPVMNTTRKMGFRIGRN